MPMRNIFLTWHENLDQTSHLEKSQLFRDRGPQKGSLVSLTVSYSPEVALFETTHFWDLTEPDKCPSLKMGQGGGPFDDKLFEVESIQFTFPFLCLGWPKKL